MQRLQSEFDRQGRTVPTVDHWLVVLPVTKHGSGIEIDIQTHLPPECPEPNSAIWSAVGTLCDEPAAGLTDQAWCSLAFGERDSWDAFARLAADAGKLLLALSEVRRPYLTERLLLPGCPLCARARLAGASSSKSEVDRHLVNSWLLAMYELGWQAQPDSPLRLHRWVWSGKHQMQYRNDEDLDEMLRGFCGGAMYPKSLATDNPIPPRRYFGRLEMDLCRASVFAIDLLRRVAAPPESKTAQIPEPNPALLVALPFGADTPTASGTPIEPDDLITQQEAADYVGIHAKTIRRRIKEGVLTRYSKGRVSLAEVKQKRLQLSERKPRPRRTPSRT